MRKHRLVIYVTLLGDSNKAEYYAVSNSDDEPSDLINDGFSDWWRVPSVVAEWLQEWAEEKTAAPSPSTFLTSR